MEQVRTDGISFTEVWYLSDNIYRIQGSIKGFPGKFIDEF